MTCSWCRSTMAYVHGHASCVNGSCPMFGLNQAECCDGETAETCPSPTATVAGRFPVESQSRPSGWVSESRR